MDEIALVNQAVLGEQLDQFWKSEIGNYLLAKVERECIIALDQLSSVDPTSPDKVREYQNSYWRAMSFKSWMEDGIVAGMKAKEILEERDE